MLFMKKNQTWHSENFRLTFNESGYAFIDLPFVYGRLTRNEILKDLKELLIWLWSSFCLAKK